MIDTFIRALTPHKTRALFFLVTHMFVDIIQSTLDWLSVDNRNRYQVGWDGNWHLFWVSEFDHKYRTEKLHPEV